MDIFLLLSPSGLALFHSQDTFDRLKRVNERYGYRGLVSFLENALGGKYKFSQKVIQHLPTGIVPYVETDNPFNRRWRRVKGKNLFEKGNTRRPVPPATDLKPIQTSLMAPGLRENTAYITNGYGAKGSYATVKTLVAYNGHICVIKTMGADEDDLFELVTQTYLFEQLHAKQYKHIKVPKIFFIQRTTHSRRTNGVVGVEKKTDVCMERARGQQLVAFARQRGSALFLPMAHVMKALWHLQRDFQFMHRDLSGSNVCYDSRSRDVTFIDFGMTCINPQKRKEAWQNDDQTFFIQSENSRAKYCTNVSFDVCILIAQMTYTGHPWLTEQHDKMKAEMKASVEASQNEKAKALLRGGDNYTDISLPNWTPGNLLKAFDPQTGEGDGPHWWIYNMVEFPLPSFSPENVLTRLLDRIPIREWFAIRRKWTSTFDNLIPNDVKVMVKASCPVVEIRGKIATLVELYGKNKLVVRVANDLANQIIESRHCSRYI